MALVKIRGVSVDPPDRIKQLQQLLHEGGVKMFDIAPSMVAEIISERKWIGRKNSAGERFNSFEHFASQPLWDGLDCEIADLLSICRKRPEVQKLINAEVQPIAKHGANQYGGDNNIISSVQGTDPTYVLKRLKRDRPDLAEKVVSGELSANAAAIEAGFRRKSTPFETIVRLWPKLTDEERDHVRAMG